MTSPKTPEVKSAAEKTSDASLARRPPSGRLETFANPNAKRDFLIHMRIPEFTCLCPMTGQPDFATLIIDYVPDNLCIELKSLKLYIWSYREQGAFHEAVSNRIVDDLARACRPRYLRLLAQWYVRGGIFTEIVVEHRKKGGNRPKAVDLSSLAQATSQH